MANLPINKDVLQKIAEKKAKEAIAKKQAEALKKSAQLKSQSKNIPKPKGVIDIKALSQTVNASLPDGQKPKGLSKLGGIIKDQGLQLAASALPLVEAYALQLAIDTASENLPDVCPPQDTIDSILTPLNNIINTLNTTSKFVEDINKLMQQVSIGATVISTTSTVLDVLIPTLTAAADLSPLAPGALVAGIDKVDYVNKKLIFKKDGTPRLPEILVALGGVTLSTSIVSFYVKKIKDIINKIINVIKRCSPNSTIENFNSSVETLSKQQEQSTANQDNLYKGFLLKIVEVEFNNQLNRRKAVAYNGNGIPTLETELSFTTNTQTLINELKQIIDESGLIGDYIPSPQPPPIDQDLFAEPSLGNKDVKIQILNNRIQTLNNKLTSEQQLLNQGIEKFLTQNRRNAYFNVPVPKYILPINSINYSLNNNLLQNFINEVYMTYPYAEDKNKRTVDTNVPILKSLFDNLKPYVFNIPNIQTEIGLLKGELDFIEGRASKADIPLNSLNNPVAISIQNP